MDIQAYQERLNVLLNGQVITMSAYNVALMAFKEMLKIIEKNEIEQAEMLFTHLPMALTRIEKGEKVDSSASEIMKEVKKSPYFELVKAQVSLIEKFWNRPLPEAEKDYLYMHYSTVFSLNL